MEEVRSLGDLWRPRWSIGVRKKEDWEGKTKEVTLNQVSHGGQQRERQPELQELEDDEEEGRESDHADLMVNQVRESDHDEA